MLDRRSLSQAVAVKSRRLFGLAVCLTFLFVPSASAQLLPQDHPYQVELYNWMESLTLSDVTIPQEMVRWDGTYASSNELANLWLETSVRGVTNPVYPTGVMKGEARWFILDDGNGAGIEGSGVVRNARYPNTAAYWYQRSFPLAGGGEGNPYYQNQNLCTRALVTTAVDMIMSDYYHDEKENPWGDNAWIRPSPRFLGGVLNGWTYAYRICKGTLDANVQQTFENGFARMAQKLLDQGVSKNTPNMQTRVLPSMANIYMSTNDAAIKDLAVRTARKYMFGYEDGVLETKHKFPESLFYPAGYVQEGFGPETTYNGVSLYHLMEARAITIGDATWNFMDEPIKRMSIFRAHQVFEEPDGLVDGPSAYAGRTGDSWAGLQAGHDWRDLAIAGYFDEGKMFGYDLVSESEMSTRIKAIFKAEEGTRMFNNFMEVNTEQVPEFAIDHDHHWPSYIPYTGPEGWYNERVSMVAANEPATVTPFSRNGYYFSKSFADDFWSYKGTDGERDFGFFVETESDGGTYSGYRGGSLQAFWVKGAGIFVLGRQDKASDSREWGDIEMWGTHHLWGKNQGGAFSTAVQRKRTVAFDLANESPNVNITGLLTSEKHESPVELDAQMTFTALSNGLKIDHAAVTDGAMQLKELWASLPIYLRYCNPDKPQGKNQCDLNDATIEYWDGNAWKNMGTTLISTTKLRIGRDFGQGSRYINLVFPDARLMKLSPKVWQQTYQADSRLRTIHISMIDDPGTLRTIDATVNMSFSIVTSDNVGTPPANVAPAITLTAPSDNATFNSPADITLTANATDDDGTVTKVAFYVGNDLLGEDTDGGDGWSLNWNGVVEGNYTISAIATDDDDASQNSSTVTIDVIAPGMNQVPTVSLTGPTTNTTFDAPATIQLTATAADADGSIKNVRFYEGNTELGVDRDGSDGWTFEWNDVAEGAYTLSAVATDNENASTTSEVVEITVEGITATDNEDPNRALTFALNQNFPNPFQRSTNVSFEIPDVAHVEVRVFDITGREVRALMDGTVPAGRHQILWDATGLTSGTYIIRLQTDEQVVYRQATLLR